MKLFASLMKFSKFLKVCLVCFVCQRNISILLFLLNMYFHRDKTECSGALKASYILKALIRCCVEGASLLSINMPLFLFLISNKIVSYGIFKLCFFLSQRLFLNIFYP